MIIQLEKNISEETKRSIIEKIRLLEYKSNEVRTQKGSYLVCIG